MEQQKVWLPDKHKRAEVAFLLVLLLFGLGFFVWNAHLELASDDIGWLRGETPTVFDQYRYIPRIFFTSLHALFGPNAIAALVMIFAFHVINTLLVYRLCQALMGSPVAAGAAAFVFLVNPITLATLTWISCFSYVLGTSLALASLLAFWMSVTESADKPFLWWGVALACYVIALFCSHEVFFLPMIFLLLGWMRGSASWRRATTLFAVAMTFAVLVNSFVYDFGRYEIEPSKLYSLDFVSAFASSALSFGLSLTLAYPLSFLVKPLDFLRVCFTEPLRWGMTLVLLASGILSYKPNTTWRLRLSLALSFIALVAPYIIRLHLMPARVNYHISYVLSGRVFYLSFSIIALIWGGIVAKLYGGHARERRLTWALPILCVLAYFHALLILYDRTDFIGLAVLHNPSQRFPPPWTPYGHSQPAWLAGSALVTIAFVAMRFSAEELKKRRVRHEAPPP